MEISEIKKQLSRPRQIIKEIADISDVYLSEVLNDKKNPEAKSAKIALNVAQDLAEGIIELEKKLREKYAVIIELNNQ